MSGLPPGAIPLQQQPQKQQPGLPPGAVPIRRATPPNSQPELPPGAKPLEAKPTDSGLSGYTPVDKTPPNSVIAKYLPAIAATSKKYGVPDWVLRAVIGQEGGKMTDYRTRESLRSPAGALGLAQFMPDTAKGMNLNPLDPTASIDGMGRYLKSLFAGMPQGQQNWPNAAAAYNMGGGAFADHLKRGTPLPRETAEYVADIGLAAKNQVRNNQKQVAAAVHKANQPAQLPQGAHALPAGAKPLPSLAGAQNPMDQAQPAGGPGPVGGDELPAMVHSGLTTLAGHQDLPFILYNAAARDGAGQTHKPMWELLKDPNSHVAHAFELWKHDPGQAMDEYGLGSSAQSAYMQKHFKGTQEGREADFMQRNPLVNALYTFGVEQGNPMAWAEGGAAGKALDLAGGALRTLGVEQHVQKAAQAVGLGSPLHDLHAAHGPEASQWMQSTINAVNAPHNLLHMATTDEMNQHIFGGLTPQAQNEVVRLKQGLKPNPQFAAEHETLEARAKMLRDDMAQVDTHQQRVGTLTPERTFNQKKFFPMKNSYTFGPQAELEAELKGGGAPGAGRATAQHKVFQNLDQAVASGNLDQEFLPATNYRAWREARLKGVAFEDSINRAPVSVRRDIESTDFQNSQGVPLSKPWQRSINQTAGEALDKIVEENHAKFGPGDPRRYDLAANPKWVAARNLMRAPGTSPALEKSMVAPELWKFLQSNKGLARYIDQAGTWLPGQEQTPIGKLVATFRNMIISNFIFHPVANVAGNDAAARGVYNLGGPQFEVGGYAYNAAMSIATQLGLRKPEAFVGGAQEYAHWMDRAMKAAGTVEFGGAAKSALGGDYARTMTTPSKGLLQRLDRALTKAGDFNRERTFGEKGEQAFAVSLFKDAVERGGMSDAKAGEVVRQALGDYYNFDPKSPWSSFFFFMPWLKSNTKFWMNTLVRRPQYATGTAHAMRNYGLQEDPEHYQGAYPSSDFSVPIAGRTYTPPFVGRDVGHIAQAAGDFAQGKLMGAAAPLAQMIEGRANPIVGSAIDLKHTIDNYFSPDVKGPENDWHMIENPKAPPDVQFHQAAAYFASHLIPIPLFGYAIQDAARRGVSRSDLIGALVTATGAGYVGDPELDPMSKRQLSQAAKRYKKAYEQYQYPGANQGDADRLHDAWDRYMDRFQEITEDQ